MAVVERDSAGDPERQWHEMMIVAYRYLSEEPERARFLTQLEESPFEAEARRRLDESDNSLHHLAADPRLAGLLADLPLEVLYALSFGVVVKLIASGVALAPTELDRLIAATWRAITVGGD